MTQKELDEQFKKVIKSTGCEVKVEKKNWKPVVVIVKKQKENDGTMDYTMIITKVNGCSGSNYGCIKVAYHNYKNYLKEKARSLSSINRQYHYKATFYIFRLTFGGMAIEINI